MNPLWKSRHLLVFLTLQFSIFSVCFAGSHKPRSVAVVDFETIHDNGNPIIHVKLNGDFDATFMIDTGSAYPIVSDLIVKKLHLSTNPAFINGQPEILNGKQLNVAVVKTFKAGLLVINDMPLYVLPNGELFKYPEQKLDGIIGIPILKQFAVLLDYPDHKLDFIASGQLSDKEREALGMSNATMVKLRPYAYGVPDGFPLPDYAISAYEAPVDIVNGNKSVSEFLLVDTGAPVTGISFDVAQRLGLVPYDREQEITLDERKSFTALVKVPQFKISDQVIPDFTVRASQQNDGAVPPLLGEDVLSYGCALFDFPDSKLYLLPTLVPRNANATLLSSDKIDKAKLISATNIFSFPPAGINTADAIDDSDTDGHVENLKAKLKNDGSDGKTYDEIGDAYYDDHQFENAQISYEKAVKIQQAFVLLHPNDEQATADLIVFTTDAQQLDAAIALGQTSTLKFPNSPAILDGYGIALGLKAVEVVTGLTRPHNSNDDFIEFQSLVNTLHNNPPSKDQLKESDLLSKQARDCADRAVSLAPTDANVYKHRNTINFIEQHEKQYLLAQSRENGKFGDAFVDPDSYFDDFDQQAQYTPTDANILVMGCGIDLRRAENHQSDSLDFGEGALWKSIHQNFKTPIQAKIDLLTAISNSTEPIDAAKGLDGLGDVELTLKQDKVAAENYYKSALVKDPLNGDALKSLCVMYSNDERYSDLRDYVKGLPNLQSNALAQLILCRTATKLGYWQEAEDAATLAVKLKPDSFTANLAMAYQLLADQDADSVGKAKSYLDKAQSRLGGRIHSERAKEMAIAWSIYDALTGDEAGAEKQALDLLTWYPSSTQARDILAAITIPTQEAAVTTPAKTAAN